MHSNISSHPGANHIHRALAHIINLAKSGENPEELALLKQRHAGKLLQLKRVIQGSELNIHSDFICPPSACDSTQPEDLGYGSINHKLDMIDYQRTHPTQSKWRPDNRPYGRLSTERNLCMRVMGKQYLFHRHDNPNGIIPEISGNGKRRCLYVAHNGIRCLDYSSLLVCRHHMAIVKHSPHLHESFVSNIKSIPLKEAYERHLKDPHKKAIDAEIALMRTMLDALMVKVGNDDIKDMPFAHIIAVTKMCEVITKAVERMAAIEQKMQLRVSVDQVNNFANNLLELMVETLKPSRDQLLKLQECVQKSPLFSMAVDPDSVKEAEFYAKNEAEQKMTKRNHVIFPDGKVDTTIMSEEAMEALQKSKRDYHDMKYGRTPKQPVDVPTIDQQQTDTTPTEPTE